MMMMMFSSEIEVLQRGGSFMGIERWFIYCCADREMHTEDEEDLPAVEQHCEENCSILVDGLTHQPQDLFLLDQK